MRTKGVLLTKNELLDAAERVILDRGLGKLTMQAIAAEASVSKGSVVYHFGSMDSLVDAMAARIAEAWEADYERFIAETPPGPGRVVRAFLDHCFTDPKGWPSALRRMSKVMLAAAAHNEAAIEPIRGVFAKYSDLAEADGLPEGIGRAAVALMDGVWFYWMLELVPMPSNRFAVVKQTITAMIEPHCGELMGGHSPPDASVAT